MHEEILKFWHDRPFVPFTVYVDTGTSYIIPTPDHLHPAAKLLFVFDDEGYAHMIPYDHIRQLMAKDLQSA